MSPQVRKEQKMQITAAMVKELRERTGAGMMECKKALVAVAGDIEAAVEEGRLDPERYESYLRLEEEIEELNRRRRKRRMATERWAKRNSRVKARNLADRIELEKEERGET